MNTVLWQTRDKLFHVSVDLENVNDININLNV